MPPVIPPTERWLADQLAQIKRDIAAAKAQQTQFVVDSTGTAQAIIGNLAFDPAGNATGLSGFGIAELVGGVWVKPANGQTVAGDLSGTLPNPTVAKVNGTTVPLTGSAWTAPTLTNSWANLGGAFETAGYLKDPLGFVHLKGMIQSGTGAAFTLPAGYRPGATGQYPYQTSAPSSGFVQITSAGVVSPSATAITGLSGITFLAEN